MKWPMKLCLTFDDGLKTHVDVAAPLLGKYGFKAAFNVPMEFLESSEKKLNNEQLIDCCLVGHESNLMDWRDINYLLSQGHEVYPHTLGHVDLVSLEKRGKFDELRQQIVGSKCLYEKHLGRSPKFFCSPHNSCSQIVLQVLHENKMEIVSCNRRNFPTHPSRTPSKIPVSEYLRDEYRKGSMLVDIMIHGIDAMRGGWEPFSDSSEFEDFLKSIKTIVAEGIVKVVPYSAAHHPYSWVSRPLRLFDRIVSKVRRKVFTLSKISQ